MTFTEALSRLRHVSFKKAPDPREWREVHKALIAEAKAVGCADCGTLEWLSFDHMPGRAKAFSPANPRWYRTLAEVEEEIAKCEVVCVPCHRFRERVRDFLGFHRDGPQRPPRINLVGTSPTSAAAITGSGRPRRPPRRMRPLSIEAP
jgi:hypothetical protein